MTALIEPVVGMEYRFFGGKRTVVAVSASLVSAAGTDAVPSYEMRRYSFIHAQTFGALHVVLWTVGPADEPGELKQRLGWWCPGGERAVDFGSYFPVYPFDPDAFAAPRNYGRRQATERALVALWPTKAAALAAGKAHGWEKPVARRVVIGGSK